MTSPSLPDCLGPLEQHRAMRKPRYLDDLSVKQRDFFADPSKMKAAVCGRRAGKTWVDAVGLYAACREVRSMNPYVTLSGVQARRIFWPVLRELDAKYGLGLKFNDQELIATVPENGSQIFCVGGDNPRKVEALRGGKYRRVVVDEYGSFPRELGRYLIDDVLDAALLDLDGDLWVTGSPNAACVGHFHDLTTGADPEVAKIATHHWTVLDNPYIPHAAEWLRRKRENKRWTEDHPVYRREYLGHWVRDLSSLVFRFDRARHLAKTAPAFTRSVLGVDIGASEHERTTALVVSGWTRHDRTVRTTYAKRYGLLIPSALADEGHRLCAEHGCAHAVMDPGGLGKGYIGEWRARHAKDGVLEAQKANKLAFVEMLNGELDSGNVQILDCADTRDLVGELELLQWNEDRDGYDERFDDHCADAWLYSWRDCYAWTEKDPPDAGPQPGTPDWIAAEARKAKEAAIEAATRRDRRKPVRFRAA